MYAIFEDGSRQYRVSEGDVVRLDERSVELNDELELGRVLLLQTEGGVQIGRPVIDGARVIARVVDFPSIKVQIQKFRRRKNYVRLRGHRQPYVAVEILHILAPGQQRPTRQEQEAAAAGAQEQAAGQEAHG